MKSDYVRGDDRLTIILGKGQRERLKLVAESNRTNLSTIARNLLDIGLATIEE